MKAYLQREDFQRFWEYSSPAWARKFLREWRSRAKRSRIEPLAKLANTLLTHETLLLNWFRAEGALCGNGTACRCRQGTYINLARYDGVFVETREQGSHWEDLHSARRFGTQQRLTVIHVNERGQPSDREPIQWKLLTDLPVKILANAMEKVEWYTQRWKIETSHKILKSGCKAEESKLRTAPRLANFFALLCILGWRVFRLIMMNRTNPKAPAKNLFTMAEISILELLTKGVKPNGKRTVGDCLNALARLGGYLNRRHDAAPGNMVF